MKKILLPFIFSVAIGFTAKAQTPALNKQQTIDYITKLWKANYDDAEGIITSVKVEGKAFAVVTSREKSYRTDLAIINVSSLNISNSEYKGKPLYNIIYVSEDTKTRSIIFGIQLESDAIRLKKALEHLIELVKAEKSTDPFDN